MTIVYIGLGSNMSSDHGGTLISPAQHIISAIQSIGELESINMMNTSSLYQSKPVGPQDQGDYVNAVLKLETDLSAIELLDRLQDIENDHGRKRQQHWGPRTLDLDILLFGDHIIENERLSIPHPEISNRSFVLVPLAEIEPASVIPTKGPVGDLLVDVDQTDLKIMQ
jgi:2-amino-4-hydroxy-6-hydroxymethyldihydropteridine diphosphokinase